MKDPSKKLGPLIDSLRENLEMGSYRWCFSARWPQVRRDLQAMWVCSCWPTNFPRPPSTDRDGTVLFDTDGYMETKLMEITNGI